VRAPAHSGARIQQAHAIWGWGGGASLLVLLIADAGRGVLARRGCVGGGRCPGAAGRYGVALGAVARLGSRRLRLGQGVVCWAAGGGVGLVGAGGACLGLGRSWRLSAGGCVLRLGCG